MSLEVWLTCPALALPYCRMP